jgi:cytosol alanyl aminopeptidase
MISSRARRALGFIGLSSAVLSCGGASSEPVAPPPPEPAKVAMQPATPPPIPEDPAPKGRLYPDVRPAGYVLDLTLDPRKDTFSGTVEIEVVLTKPRSTIWMHARGLTATAAHITPANGPAVEADFAQVEEGGTAALRAHRPIPAGHARIAISFTGAFGKQLKGLYRATEAGESYAFTQFEAISAREAFPCFDEPVFKTPWDVVLRVPPEHEAIANTHEIDRATENGMKRLKFASTEPIPSYLVAFASGPIDIVTAPPVPPNAVRKAPLPLRGVSAKGRGKELAYALAHTGEILDVLEKYTGIPYPYDKLDVLAVPDKEGAMENPGAVTFREYLLLLDEKTAPVGQKRAFAYVMAHELAHMWFGDLVTMPWWDEIWLNEAFATWMGSRAAQLWQPDTQAEIVLLERIQDAMSTDSLVSARRIRQPIESDHDIQNAFDQITYQKGGGVIAMFERWMGPAAFQKGIHDYLQSHRMGTATADDLLTELGKSAGKDVATPFKTFLDQPGVPLLEAEVVCDPKPRMHLRQSRFLPLGSKGNADSVWQIPVCARYGTGKTSAEACTLLTAKEGDIPLGDRCPEWALPNADAAGYFRFTMQAKDTARMSKHVAALSTREKIAFANGLRSGFSRGTTPAEDVLAALAPLAGDEQPAVADEPMGLLRTSRDWLEGDPLRPKVEAYGRKLYAPVMAKLGWRPKSQKDETPERRELRQSVLAFLSFVAMDPAVRKEAARLGRAYAGIDGDGKLHPEVVEPELAGIALSVAVEEGGAPVFDAVLGRLGTTEDDLVRGRILGALGSARDPKLAERARQLTIDGKLRVSESMAPLFAQMGQPEVREATFRWMKEHVDALITKLPSARAASLPYLAMSFCDEAHAADVESFFGGRIEKLEGGPRNLSSAVEGIRLCAARRAKQEESVRAFFRRAR